MVMGIRGHNITMVEIQLVREGQEDDEQDDRFLFFFWSYSSTAAPLPSFIVRFIFTCMPTDQVRASVFRRLGLGHCCVVVVAGALLRHLKKYWDDLC
jgi:hypothetical protein